MKASSEISPPFSGTIEKIEPQAIVEQNVTMFPVLVALPNPDGRLRPGMNVEVSFDAARRETLYLGFDTYCGFESRSMIRLMRLIGLPVTILGPALPHWGEERFPARFDLRDALSFLAAHSEPKPV